MPEDMYGGMDDSAPGSSAAMPAPEDGAEKPDDKMDGETALIPKSLLAGKDFQVGEEVVLKIVHDHGDEVEVEYAPEKPDEGKGDMGKPEMDMADEKLGAMAQ